MNRVSALQRAGRLDVSDLSDRQLAAVIAVTSPADVAYATGLPLAFLTALTPVPEGAADYELCGCPRCGSSCSTRYSSPHQRCLACRREMREERFGRARSVLAAGLTGDEARAHIMDTEGCSEWVARKLLTAARKQLAVA